MRLKIVPQKLVDAQGNVWTVMDGQYHPTWMKETKSDEPKPEPVPLRAVAGGKR
jgi:hypothetical protein